MNRYMQTEQPGNVESQPSATVQPVGHATKPGLFGHQAIAAHVTSQLHDEAQSTPPLQLSRPVQSTVHLPVPQRFMKLQLWSPEHVMLQSVELLQRLTAGHALGPVHSRVHGPAPHSTPK